MQQIATTRLNDDDVYVLDDENCVVGQYGPSSSLGRMLRSNPPEGCAVATGLQLKVRGWAVYSR